MVETEKENAFAIITFLDDRIDFDSFGREQNRNLYIY